MAVVGYGGAKVGEMTDHIEFVIANGDDTVGAAISCPRTWSSVDRWSTQIRRNPGKICSSENHEKRVVSTKVVPFSF